MTGPTTPSHHVSFEGSRGATLAGRLDLPAIPTHAYALFAHCFTCSKDIKAAGALARRLTDHGVGVLRFDFTGLGHSDGEFACTSFSSNVGDLERAAGWLRDNYEAPEILIGHSLGGAAVVAAGVNLDEVKAVVTINAPSSTEHVTNLFGEQLATITSEGDAQVVLGGRPFTIRKDFVDDLANHSILAKAAELGPQGKALLVMHAPTDQTVGIDHAKNLYEAARHPKSFIALDGADHLLTSPGDAEFAAGIVAAWSQRYTRAGDSPFPYPAPEPGAEVVVAETGVGTFLNHVTIGQHSLLADEPTSVGGFDAGPAPYDFLAAGLGACTSMTLRLYARRKKMALDQVSVEVDHAKVRNDAGHPIDTFTRTITTTGELTDDDRASLLRIADKCPVHRSLEASSHIVTEYS